jgi:hypothetical protein
MARPRNPETIPRSNWATVRVPRELHHRAKAFARRREMRLQDATAFALKLFLDAKSPPTFGDDLKIYLRVIRERLEKWDRPGVEAILSQIEKRFL